MPRQKFIETNKVPKTLIIGVDSPYNKTENIDSYFEEFENLVTTSGTPFIQALYIKLRKFDPGYFFSRGKLEQIKQVCEQYGIEQVIISDQLSPQQARNLEDFLNVTIADRTDLILDIFDKAAVSAEGKAQVAIAVMQHKKTRLAGKGIHMGQQKGGKGFIGGFGEKAKEREKRHIEEQILKYKRHLKALETTRATQRKKRIENRIPHICLIGYTNAGKSTILNALTKSDVLAEDKLFATLDTTTRALFIDGKQKGVLSDTVGFIQQLPHKLIEAFKSTLSELQYADLLLQVIDLSDSNWEEHIKVVHKILADLGIEKEMLYVFNKADEVDDIGASLFKIEFYQPNVIISAIDKKKIQPLINFLKEWQPHISGA